MGALKDSYIYLNEKIPIFSRKEKAFYCNISAIDDQEIICDENEENNIETEPNFDNCNQSFRTIQEDQLILDKDNVSINDMNLDNKSTFRYTNAYKRFTETRNLTSSRKSINSYNEYWDINNQEGAKLTSQESYPSLYNNQNQPKLPLEKNLDKIVNIEQKQSFRIKNIQTFRFLSYEINVDSLVRLFIIA